MTTEQQTDEALVAEKLLGWTSHTGNRWQSQSTNGYRYWERLDWLRTGDGMLAILEALRAQGWHWQLEPVGKRFYAKLLAPMPSKFPDVAVYADTLPDTVLAAATAVLRAEAGDGL